jgi:hypothetical protein
VVALVMIAGVALGGCEQRRTLEDGPAAAGADKPAPSGPKRFSFDGLAHTVEQGKPAQVSLLVLPGGDLKINPDYPWKAVIAPNAALGISAPVKLTRDGFTFADATATLPISLTAAQAGDHKLEASVWLSVCEKGDSQRCLWFEEEPVTLAIKVSPGAAAPAEAPAAPAAPAAAPDDKAAAPKGETL